MITLYSGIPGSGKSYRMVNDLTLMKNEYYVVHNIDGFKEGYLGPYECQFEKYCKEQNMEVIDFFSKDYQIQFAAAVMEKYNRNCLVIIDEAHEWFDKNKKQLKMWLSYHRHLNQEVWLVAHRSTNFPAVYRSFIAQEYRAKQGSILCVPGYFLYNRIVGGESVGYQMVRKKKEIFKLYKSQNTGFIKKRPSLFIPIIMLLCLAGVAYFFYMPQYIMNKGARAKEGYKKPVSVETTGIKEAERGPVENEDVKFKYSGNIGRMVLIEDISTGRVVPVSELSEYKLISVNQNGCVLYDKKAGKTININKNIVGQGKNHPIPEGDFIPEPHKVEKS